MTIEQLIGEIYTASSNPAKSYFLPVVLLEQWPPADPWSIASLNFGDLASVDPNLPSNLCAALGGKSIASPASAMLSLSNLVVTGLANAVLAQPTLTDSAVTATVNFGGAMAPPGLLLQPQIQVSAEFTITLACCPSQDGSTCDSSPQPTTIVGTVTMAYSSSSASFAFDVAPDFSASFTSASFTGTAATSPQPSPHFAVSSPFPAPIPDSLGTLLNTAFQGAAGQAAIATLINQTLATGALTVLGNGLTPVLQEFAKPSMVSFFVSELYQFANNPNSSLYLPNQIKGASNPVLEPFNVPGTLNLGDVSALAPGGATIICGIVGGPNEICAPETPVTLILDNLVITGCSNAQVLPMLTVEDPDQSFTVEGLVVLNQVDAWPVKFSISGDFTLTLSCCASTDGQTCASSPQPQKGTGTFNASISTCSAAANIEISVAPDGQSLVATVNGMAFQADPNVQNPNNVTISIDITSVPPIQQQAWTSYCETIFNSPQALKAIISQVQAQMNGPGVLQQISQMITAAIASLPPGGRRQQ